MCVTVRFEISRALDTGGLGFRAWGLGFVAWLQDIATCLQGLFLQMPYFGSFHEARGVNVVLMTGNVAPSLILGPPPNNTGLRKTEIRRPQ